MVSLGVASFGHFRGTHYQNEKDFGPYVERIGRGELPIGRALGMSEEEKLIRELILQMKLGRLEGDYFRRKFGVDIFTRFAAPLARLRDAGHLTIAGDCVLLGRQGLLRVDELLHEFFLPQHQHARYT
jgi:oxygen-independent coproporphyrinogen-3 oxidase